MEYLSVEKYDAAQNEAMAWIPNRVIQAFQPTTFQSEGYPFRVSGEAELFKYMDVMHELRFERDIDRVLGGGLTEEEFGLLKRIAQKASSFLEERFGRKAAPRGALLRMINVFRHLKYLYPTERLKVFEIGGGCGYLGAMFLDQGWNLAATDVSQAFYLYQNHLWNHLTNGAVAELATEEGRKRAGEGAAQALHIPWWEFVGLAPEMAPEVDVITCNHAFCEMHPQSLAFTLKIAKALWKGKLEGKALVFEGWGHDAYNSQASVMERMHKEGFSLVFHDYLISVLVPAGSQAAQGCQLFPRQKTRQVMTMGSQGPEVQTLTEPDYEPQTGGDENNPLVHAVLAGRGRTKSSMSVDREGIIGFYRGLLGSDDMLTADEKFLMMVE